MSSPGRPPALFGGAHLPERLNDETARKFPKSFGRKNLLTKKNFGWKNYPSCRARAQRAALADYLVEPALRVVVVREALLVGAEGLCVVVAPAVDEARGVLDVKHLVVEDVFDEPFGHIARVQRLADDDRVVDSVVVAEYCARAALRPRKSRRFDLASEVSLVQALEHSSEIVDAPLGSRDHLAPALAAREVGGAQHVGRARVFAVDPLVEGRRATAQELRDEYEGERAVDAHRRVLENVGEAHVDAPRAQSYGVVQSGVRVVAHVGLGRGALGRERAERFDEERAERWLRVGHKRRPLQGSEDADVENGKSPPGPVVPPSKPKHFRADRVG